MKRLFLGALMVILVAGLILGGCAKTTTTSTTTAATQTQTSTSTTTTTPHKVLKIGGVIGLNTPQGVEQKKWFDLFAKLINDNGGWKIGSDTYDVDMIIYDGQNDPTQSMQYLEKLVLQDGVKIILGSPTGNPATDAQVTEPNKVMVLGYDVVGTSADPKIQYYWTPQGMMFFGRGYMYQMYYDAASKGYNTYVSLKSDDIFGHVADGWCKDTWALAAPGVKYGGTVFYDPSTADYGPVATKLMSLNPDVIDLNYCSVSQGPIDALYDAGYKGKFVQVDPSVLDNIITHCGKAFVEGADTGIEDPTMIPNTPPEMLAYVNAYMKEYGTWQQGVAASWVCNWFVLQDAINATQSVDVDVLKAYLDKSDHSVRTLTGYTELFARPDANNLRTISGVSPVYVGTVEDGKIVTTAPVTVKENYLSTIMSEHLVDVYKAYWAQYGYPTFPADEKSIINFSDLGITGHD